MTVLCHYEKRSDEVIPKEIAAATPRNDGKTSAMTEKTLARWVAQFVVACCGAVFRLTAATAVEAQRLCLCIPRGNNSLDLTTGDGWQ